MADGANFMEQYGHWKSRTKIPHDAKAFSYFMIFQDRTGNISYYIGYKVIDKAEKWKDYNTSSKMIYANPSLLNNCIHREITNWFSDKLCAVEYETSELIHFNAAKTKMFLNRSNGNKDFVCVSVSSNTRKKISEKQKSMMLDPSVYLNKIIYITISLIKNNSFSINTDDLLVRTINASNIEELQAVREELKLNLIKKEPVVKKQVKKRKDPEVVKINKKEGYKKMSTIMKDIWQDPEYVAKQSAAHLASMKVPSQIANRQAEAERRAQDPKFREHLLNNLAKMKADPTVKQKQADAFKKELSHNGIIYKNPQEASAALGLSVDVIRKRCRELKDGFKYTSDRVDTKKVKKVSYNGKEYNSVTDAAKDLSISRKKITRLCESEQDGFKYIE